MDATGQGSPAPTRFLALGGVWLDEIQKGGRTLHENVLGGSVTFGERAQSERTLSMLMEIATLGARLFTPVDPSSIRMLMVKGRDFPSHVLDTLRDWQVSLSILARGDDVAAARGILHYGQDESGMDSRLFARTCCCRQSILPYADRAINNQTDTTNA